MGNIPYAGRHTVGTDPKPGALIGHLITTGAEHEMQTRRRCGGAMLFTAGTWGAGQ